MIPHRAPGLIEWLDEYENHITTSQSNGAPMGSELSVLSTTIINIKKKKTGNIFLEECCSSSLWRSRNGSIISSSDAALQGLGGSTPYYDDGSLSSISSL